MILNKDKDKKPKETSQTKLIKSLEEKFRLCQSHYQKIHKRMQVLDSTDKGELWKAIGAKFPAYQILPDTNWISYIKSNLVASIYTVTKSAEVMPTSDKDKDIVMHINIALYRIWALANVGYFQFQAGDRAALCNLGITQVGWDEELTAGSGDSFYKGNITLKNINPLKFMMDPFATSIETAGYCMTYDKYHKSVFLKNPKYKEEFQAYVAKKKIAETLTTSDVGGRANPGPEDDYYTLLIIWVKDKDGNVNEYHTINAEHILHEKLDIEPKEFPFALLYCNEPADELVGTSEPAKAFANNVAHNLMDSIALTAEYKNQRPPKFISSASGLNIQAFAKHGDEADKTFIVNGKPNDVVYYHQFPQSSPALPSMIDRLTQGIQTMTGVDHKYTGKNTGSITTTGGVEEMLNRATIIDTPKIMHYEKYTRRLTHLILNNLISFAPRRKYFYKKPNSTQWESVEVDFPKIDKNTLFDYQINISSELPNNKQRVAQMANMLMEKQMQYQEQGSSVQLITEEEWLMMQDLPNKELMLERMGIQRLTSKVEEVSQTLFQYAELLKQGMNPNDAIMATANSLQQQQMGMGPETPPIPGAAPEMMMQGPPMM